MWDVGLTRDGPGLLLKDIFEKDAPDVLAAREHILSNAPDILLLAGFDTDFDGVTAKAFADFVDGGYAYTFSTVGNAGVPSTFDLDRDGRSGEPEDAWAYGDFRGDGGLAILSKLPIQYDAIRTLTDLRWTELPRTRMPRSYFDPDAAAAHPLSSHGHWIVPVNRGGGAQIDLLAFKAATPVFDGPEDRNGRRNADEIALWRHYVDGALPLKPRRPFVIVGNANLDPVDGEGRHGEIIALLNHPAVQDPMPHRRMVGISPTPNITVIPASTPWTGATLSQETCVWIMCCHRLISPWRTAVSHGWKRPRGRSLPTALFGLISRQFLDLRAQLGYAKPTLARQGKKTT